MDPCADEDDARASELPEEAERPSCVVTLAVDPRPLCRLCERAPRARRGFCWSCYDKFRECGLTLPDREPAGRPPTPSMRRGDDRAEPSGYTPDVGEGLPMDGPPMFSGENGRLGFDDGSNGASW